MKIDKKISFKNTCYRFEINSKSFNSLSLWVALARLMDNVCETDYTTIFNNILTTVSQTNVSLRGKQFGNCVFC